MQLLGSRHLAKLVNRSYRSIEDQNEENSEESTDTKVFFKERHFCLEWDSNMSIPDFWHNVFVPFIFTWKKDSANWNHFVCQFNTYNSQLFYLDETIYKNYLKVLTWSIKKLLQGILCFWARIWPIWHHSLWNCIFLLHFKHIAQWASFNCILTWPTFLSSTHHTYPCEGFWTPLKCCHNTLLKKLWISVDRAQFAKTFC